MDISMAMLFLYLIRIIKIASMEFLKDILSLIIQLLQKLITDNDFDKLVFHKIIINNIFTKT